MEGCLTHQTLPSSTPYKTMKTLLTLLVGLGLMTATANARDHHYSHHGGYAVHSYARPYFSGPRFSLSFGSTYPSPYYYAPYYYNDGPVYVPPSSPSLSVYYSGTRYYSGNRYYSGRHYYSHGSSHGHSHHH